jgi:hypothetical protein
MKPNLRYAEDANYWDTNVHPAKSLGEIQELLDDFGADAIMTTQGQNQGRFAWLIRFQWLGRSYHFVFTPLTCRFPNEVNSFDKKRRSHDEQAKYQMGRIAVWFVKAVLTAAEAQPGALFGFLELPGASKGSVPMTTADLEVDGLTAALPGIDVLQLGKGEQG